MKITLILTFIAFTFCGYSQTDTTNQKESFIKDNFQIQYPKSWRPDTSGHMGTELFVFSPLENDSDKFSENVNVIIQDLGDQNIDLEKYKQITDKQLEELATEGELFESVVVKTDHRDYFKIVYAMTQGKFRIKIASVCYINNNKAYLLTFSSELDKYEMYKKNGEEILMSFKLIK